MNIQSNRHSYKGQYLLTFGNARGTDTWETGLNNNVLVLGCSGGGKTRHHLKPNLLQCHGSYVVLDTKGTLYQEVGPYLQSQGYQVDRIDFGTMQGTIGYNPLDHVRFMDGEPLQQDMISIASAICPREDETSDPFWETAAANYLTSYIAYVFEALPPEERTFNSVMKVFETACRGNDNRLFSNLRGKNPDSYALFLHNMAKATASAEKMNASIMGIIAANLLPFGFKGVKQCFEMPKRVDFRQLGHGKHALFVTLNDLDQSITGLTSLFVHQALVELCDEADHNCAGNRLPVPVHFMLDDFANLYLPDFDNVLSVIRSREISATIVCQTVSQLEARYGEAAANSIVGNCDTQLVLAFQDAHTADYFGTRANRTASSLLETPEGKWWLFLRGQRGVCESAYRLEDHPAYAAMLDAQFVKPVAEAEPEDDFGEKLSALFRAKYGDMPCVIDEASDDFDDELEDDLLAFANADSLRLEGDSTWAA